MPRKALDRKGNKGKSKKIQCSACGAIVSKEKAIRQEKFSMPIDSYLAEELRKCGAQIHISSYFLYFCLSCAKHKKILKSKRGVHKG